jgi:hypothetical protein
VGRLPHRQRVAPGHSRECCAGHDVLESHTDFLFQNRLTRGWLTTNFYVFCFIKQIASRYRFDQLLGQSGRFPPPTPPLATTMWCADHTSPHCTSHTQSSKNSSLQSVSGADLISRPPTLVTTNYCADHTNRSTHRRCSLSSLDSRTTAGSWSGFNFPPHAKPHRYQPRRIQRQPPYTSHSLLQQSRINASTTYTGLSPAVFITSSAHYEPPSYGTCMGLALEKSGDSICSAPISAMDAASVPSAARMFASSTPTSTSEPACLAC